MATLFTYVEQVERMLRDENQDLIDPSNIIEYVNRARRQVAMMAQCIRFVPPISGQVTAVQVTNGGSGYSNTPTVTVSAPDSPTGAVLYPGGAQATVITTVIAGVIMAINVQFGGDGYFQPVITITDATGTGATATASTSPINVTVAKQEIYKFSNVPISNFPGVQSILNVRSVSLLYSNWRYMTMYYSFSEYQAHIRRYPRQYLYVPAVACQHGQGTAGSLYMYPIANAAYQMEWDCIGYPQDLIDDGSVEAIPDPWTDAVPFMALYYCYASLQNANFAAFYRNEFANFMLMSSAGARPGMSVNRYGRA